MLKSYVVTGSIKMSNDTIPDAEELQIDAQVIGSDTGVGGEDFNGVTGDWLVECVGEEDQVLRVDFDAGDEWAETAIVLGAGGMQRQTEPVTLKKKIADSAEDMLQGGPSSSLYSWVTSRDLDHDLLGYRVYLEVDPSLDGYHDSELVGDVPATTHQLMITVPCDGVYEVYHKAYDQDGNVGPRSAGVIKRVDTTGPLPGTGEIW